MRFVTPRRVLVADKIATVVITGVGIGVLLAVVGILVFLVGTTLPLGSSESLTYRASSSAAESFGFAFAEDEFVPAALSLTRSHSCEITLLDLKNQRPIRTFTLGLQSSGQPELRTPEADTDGLSHCIGLANSDVAMLTETPETGWALHIIALELARHFVEGEHQGLTSNLVQELNETGYVFSDEQIFIKPSMTAPTAAIEPRATNRATVTFDTLPEWWLTSPPSTTRIKFLQKTEDLSLLVVSDEVVRSAYLISKKENMFTGETTTKVATLLPSGREMKNQQAQLRNLGIIGDNWLVRFYGNGIAVLNAISDLNLDSPQSPSEWINPHAVSLGIDSLQRIVPVFGEDIFFLDTGRGACALVDGSLLNKAALAADANNGSPTVSAPLWVRECPIDSSTDAALLAGHPSIRAVARLSNDNVTIFETTTGRKAVDESVAKFTNGKATSLGFSATGNALVVQTQSQLHKFVFTAPHIDASLKTFFSPIHYDGYETATYSWQSSAANATAQAKLSFIPLIWGTLKATFYAMIFAAPLGIFAAIYCSEFLDRRSRNIIKPVVEMMASIPSVVLGFLAGAVVAPWVESHLLAVLTLLLTMPMLFYLLGNLLSTSSARLVAARGLYASKRLLMQMVVGCGVILLLGIGFGAWVEQAGFAGDLQAYLSGGPGNDGVLWGIILLPTVLIILLVLPVQRKKKLYRNLVFAVSPFVAVSVGIIFATQIDLRDSLVGPYTQRNSLVIAIAMGIAVIPIIFSLAEDALTAVPNTLRAASLAAGASVWQTTARVVLPTAMSGILSALIIGMGRAIGETMIVVMAAGNTPIMSVNPFDGLRTLSANIAIELPEAAMGSTHYRTLFLSALLLFLFTFSLNTFAEIVRTHYRKRSQAL